MLRMVGEARPFLQFTACILPNAAAVGRNGDSLPISPSARAFA